MKHYLDADNELEKAEKNFENFLKSNTCKIGEKDKNTLKKLVDEISSRAYSAGYDNRIFDEGEEN